MKHFFLYYYFDSITILLCPQIHLGPVKAMKYSHLFDTVISADVKGIIEYWSPETIQFPKDTYASFARVTNLIY